MSFYLCPFVAFSYSQFRDEYTLEQIMKSPQVVEGVLTKLQCCPTSDGSGAAILASEAFVRRHGLEKQAVEIVGMEMASDPASTFADKSLMKIAGTDMTRLATQRLFALIHTHVVLSLPLCCFQLLPVPR